MPSQLVPLVGRDAEVQAIAIALDAAVDGEAGVLARSAMPAWGSHG